MAIKSIVFDVGGTLIQFDLFRIASAFTENEADAGLLRDAFGVDWHQLDAGSMEYADYRVETLKRLPSRLRASGERMLNEWFLHEPPIPGMKEFMIEAEKRFSCYILSNAPIFFAEHIAVVPASEGIKGKLISGYERLLKPDPRIFELFLNRFELKAEESFFIDDNPENIEAAGKLGFHCCLFDGKAETARRALDQTLSMRI